MSAWHTLEKVATNAGWEMPAEPVSEYLRNQKKVNGIIIPRGDIWMSIKDRTQQIYQVIQQDPSLAEQGRSEQAELLNIGLAAAAIEANAPQRFICVESARMAELIAETSIKGDDVPVDLPSEILHFCLPKGVIIDGMEIPPFTVVRKKTLLRKLMRGLTDRQIKEIDPFEEIIFLYGDEYAYVSTNWLGKMAREEINYNNNFGSRELKGAMARIYLYSLIWMEARPDIVHEGFPPAWGRAAQDAAKKLPPMQMIGEPPERVNDASYWVPSDRSVAPHWRRPHLRHYPMKKDGTRTPGWVEVSGSLVGKGQAKTIAD